MIEKGYVTKIRDKWWREIYYQYPYLWKVNRYNNDYQEDWGDPRIAKTEKIEKEPKKQQNISNQLKKNVGKKI